MPSVNVKESSTTSVRELSAFRRGSCSWMSIPWARVSFSFTGFLVPPSRTDPPLETISISTPLLGIYFGSSKKAQCYPHKRI